VSSSIRLRRQGGRCTASAGITVDVLVICAFAAHGKETKAEDGQWPGWMQGGRSMVQQSAGDDSTGTAEGRRFRLGAGAIASLTGVGLLLVFMIQNTERVTIKFLFWSFAWPLWLFTLVTALIGAVVWIGLGAMRRHRRRKARRADRRD
jgi:uncharacterized integral membrane protein